MFWLFNISVHVYFLYRLIHLDNGLRALLISDLDGEDQHLDEDEDMGKESDSENESMTSDNSGTFFRFRKNNTWWQIIILVLKNATKVHSCLSAMVNFLPCNLIQNWIAELWKMYKNLSPLNHSNTGIRCCFSHFLNSYWILHNFLNAASKILEST